MGLLVRNLILGPGASVQGDLFCIKPNHHSWEAALKSEEALSRNCWWFSLIHGRTQICQRQCLETTALLRAKQEPGMAGAGVDGSLAP